MQPAHQMNHQTTQETADEAVDPNNALLMQIWEAHTASTRQAGNDHQHQQMQTHAGFIVTPDPPPSTFHHQAAPNWSFEQHDSSFDQRDQSFDQHDSSFNRHDHSFNPHPHQADTVSTTIDPHNHHAAANRMMDHHAAERAITTISSSKLAMIKLDLQEDDPSLQQLSDQPAASSSANSSKSAANEMQEDDLVGAGHESIDYYGKCKSSMSPELQCIAAMLEQI